MEQSRQRQITELEIEVTEQISLAYQKLVCIVNAAHRSLGHLQTDIGIYALIHVVTVMLCYNANAYVLQELIILCLDILLSLFLWISHGDRDYSMWHLPLIMGFIRGQTHLRQELLHLRGLHTATQITLDLNKLIHFE